MSQYITVAVCNGTKLSLNVSGKDVDSIMKKLHRDRINRTAIRQAKLFMFYRRKDNKLVDVRFN